MNPIPVQVLSDGIMVPVDTSLTCESEQGCQASVDYILVTASERVALQQRTAVKYFLAPANRPYATLSDHYGVAATIQVSYSNPQVSEQLQKYTTPCI